MEKLADMLERSIEEFDLSVRSYNCLKNADIQTVSDLVTKREAELLKLKGFGGKCLREVKAALAEVEIYPGIALGLGLQKVKRVDKQINSPTDST